MVGAGWAFYGLRFFTIILPIWALFFGFITGMQWGQDVFGQGFAGTVTSWIIGGVLAIVLAALSYFWYYFAVTFAVGALGYTLGVGLMDLLGIDSGFLGLVAGLVVGAAFAIITFVLGIPVVLIVLISAISGAAAMVNGVLIILGRIKVEDLDSGLLSGLMTDTTIGDHHLGRHRRRGGLVPAARSGRCHHRGESVRLPLLGVDGPGMPPARR